MLYLEGSNSRSERGFFQDFLEMGSSGDLLRLFPVNYIPSLEGRNMPLIFALERSLELGNALN